jgi:hypothetical protein
MTIKPPFTYPGDHLSKTSFPLGGIGTGSIGLSGARLLINWEIFNRPAKDIGKVLLHFAIKAECDCKVLDKRVLDRSLKLPHVIRNCQSSWLGNLAVLAKAISCGQKNRLRHRWLGDGALPVR